MVVLVALTVAVGAGCDPVEDGDRDQPAPLAPTVVMGFDGLDLPHGTSQATVRSEGSADVQVSVVTLDGGELRSGPGRAGDDDRALRTPDFEPTMPAPRAVVQVVGAGGDGPDPLDPGTATFTFGASFVLDDPSTSTLDGSVDDGDNLIQRGLYEEPSQFKLELDGRRPLCRVKGRDGEVSVVGSGRIEAGRWYRVECTRSGDRVTMTLTDLDAPEGEGTQQWSKEGETGSMTPASWDVPLSVGGKLRDGALDWHTDQFNGLIDDVVLDIDIDIEGETEGD